MPEPRSPSFLVAACAPGVEPWLKSEVAREHPELHPSFSRPGLVTFKQGPAPIEPGALRSVFARVVATSLGSFTDVAAACEAIRARASSAPPGRATGALRVLVHAGAPRPGDDSLRGMAPAERAGVAEVTRAACESALRASFDGDAVVVVGGAAAPGERVVDVFSAPGDAIWLGEHVHAAPMQPWAAGTSPVELPADAPSRAFLKIEEAIQWADLPILAGQSVVEVGSAPGGASLALLRRGVSVIGVDPGVMDPIVMAFEGGGGPTFRHLQVPVGALAKTDLPKDVDWLALDVNLAPPVALRYVERIVGPRRGRLRGAILTLKMNDAEMAAKIPALLQHVRKMGFASVRATQLPSNRREICVVALNAGERTGRASTGSSSANRPGQAKRAQPKKGKPKASRRGSSEPTST